MTEQNALFSEITEQPTITASRLPDERRITFWPQYFGTVILLEPRIFAWMDRLCEDYGGGIWHFYTLSNGSVFMAPETDDDNSEKWLLSNSMNGNDAEMSAEATGIAVCLLEYNHHACRTECDVITTHYYRLRDYALRHPDCHAIMRIID